MSCLSTNLGAMPDLASTRASLAVGAVRSCDALRTIGYHFHEFTPMHITLA